MYNKSKQKKYIIRESYKLTPLINGQIILNIAICIYIICLYMYFPKFVIYLSLLMLLVIVITIICICYLSYYCFEISHTFLY